MPTTYTTADPTRCYTEVTITRAEREAALDKVYPNRKLNR